MQICPFSGVDEDDEILDYPNESDEHLEWHFRRCVEMGYFVDNGDGTFSLTQKGMAEDN